MSLSSLRGAVSTMTAMSSGRVALRQAAFRAAMRTYVDCTNPKCGEAVVAACNKAARGSPEALRQKEEDNKFMMRMVNERRPMFSLEQDFYTTDSAYRVDMRTIWRNSWLFAGYTFQAAKPGDYFSYDVDGDNVIIIRGDDQKLRAFYNTCRHRGSRITKKESGHVGKLVCTYHQWTYDRDGKLLRTTWMPSDFNPSDHGLIPCNMEIVDGLIFINLSEKPIPFENARSKITRQLKPQGIENAKIAATISYDVKANWKLVYENNRECYHCDGGHPEYIRANYDTAFTFTTTPDGKPARVTDPNMPRRDEIDEHIANLTKRWESLGFECSSDSSFEGDGWYRASRMPLRKGWVSESMDGQPLCSKLMGDYKEQDMGSMRIHTLPNFWIHCSSDHAVSARLTPIDKYNTKVLAHWIVHKDAVEGKDYDVEKMLPFWNLTSQQDWELCEVNQRGVNSSRYTPGPLSVKKETGLETFLKWYLRRVSMGIQQGM